MYCLIFALVSCASEALAASQSQLGSLGDLVSLCQHLGATAGMNDYTHLYTPFCAV